MSTTTLEARTAIEPPKDTYPILDSDQHMVEPLDLWTSRVDKRFRDRVPRKETHHDGKDGVFLVFGDEVQRVGNKRDDGQLDWTEWKGGWDPAARLADMAVDGLAAAVLFPTWGTLGFGTDDAELQRVVFAAYNDWIAEFCSYAPDRFAGVAMISLYDPALAAKELERCRKLGLKAAMVWDAPPEELGPYWQSFYTPVWAAAEALGMPICFHKQTGPKNRAAFAPSMEKNWATIYSTMVMGQAALQTTLTNIVYGGVLERHPNLNFVCAEADIAWVPALMARMDKYYASRVRRRHDFNLSMTPSEFMLRQIWHSFLDDALGVKLYHYAGLADRVMWATDYPHPACLFPHSMDAAEKDFAGVPETDKRKILHDNVAKLFGFDL